LDLKTLSSLSIVAPAIVAIVAFKRLPKEAKYLAWLTIISAVVNLIANYKLNFFVNEVDRMNVQYFNLFAIAQYVLLNRLFFLILKRGAWKKVLNGLLVLFLIFAVVNIILWQPFNTFGSNVIWVGNISFVGFSLLYFSQLLSSERYHNLTQDWVFWLSAGLLLYNASAFVLFLMTSYIVEANRDIYYASNRLNAIFNLVLTGFYFVSLFVAAKRYKLSQVDDA
jgi:hypothetical protein